MFRLRWWLPWRRGQSQQHVDWCITDAEVVSDWTLTGVVPSAWTLAGTVPSDWTLTGATVSDWTITGATVTNWTLTAEVICCGC